MGYNGVSVKVRMPGFLFRAFSMNQGLEKSLFHLRVTKAPLNLY